MQILNNLRLKIKKAAVIMNWHELNFYENIFSFRIRKYTYTYINERDSLL